MSSGRNSRTTMGGNSSISGRVSFGGCIDMASLFVDKSNDSAYFAAAALA